jgi:hypothetical protein
MIGKRLPHQGKNALVRQNGFPRRLDPPGRRCREPHPEFVVKHPFPGIEFEHNLACSTVRIDKAAAVAPSDLRDIDQGGGEAGLYSRVFEIGECAGVLVISVVPARCRKRPPPSFRQASIRRS